jgi:ribbon-helix-helix CopG family protein
MYIMHRTQIYLSDREDAILTTESGRTGLSRSELIRDAIRRTYHVPGSYVDFKRALDSAAGSSDDAPFTGEEYVALIRTRGFGALAEVWPEYFGETDDAASSAR